MALGGQRKNVVLLGLLLGAWGVLLVLRASPSSGKKAAAPARPPQVEVARRGGVAIPADVPRFRQELLDLPVPPYQTETHNLFGSPPPPPPPPAPVVRPAPTPIPVATPVPTPPAPPPPPPPDPFFEEAKQYRLLGTARGAQGAQAFLVKGPDLVIVRANDRVGTRYVVKEIREEALTLGSAEGDKEVVLTLSPATDGRRPAPPR